MREILVKFVTEQEAYTSDLALFIEGKGAYSTFRTTSQTIQLFFKPIVVDNCIVKYCMW